jgi:hypothetical protein
LVAAAFEMPPLPRVLENEAYRRRNHVARMSHYKRKCLQLLALYLGHRIDRIAA